MKTMKLTMFQVGVLIVVVALAAFGLGSQRGSAAGKRERQAITFVATVASVYPDASGGCLTTEAKIAGLDSGPEGACGELYWRTPSKPSVNQRVMATLIRTQDGSGRDVRAFLLAQP